MTIEEENAQLKKQLKAQQTLIHIQRARITAVRNTRLALVAGPHVGQVNVNGEKDKAAEFLIAPEAVFNEVIATLEFYGRAANYRDANGLPSLTAPVPQDGGAKARTLLQQIKT